jgi:PAS domain S-box-containing protein
MSLTPLEEPGDMRKRAEEALRESEFRYRELFENANDVIYTHDLQGNIKSFNQAGENLLGYTRDEVHGMNIAQVVAPEHLERARRMIAQKVQSGGRTTYELECLTKDARRLTLEVSTRLISHEGKPAYVQGIARNITERKLFEAQLRQAQKMEAIGQLAGGIAHDFNNLLTAILGNLSLVLAGLPGYDPNRELLEEAETASVRAAGLIRQMLGISRKAPAHPQPTNLNATVEEVVGLLQRSIDPRIIVDVQCDPGLGMVYADPNQMNQVVMNLCLNARDAMPSGGRLTLSTQNIELDKYDSQRRPEARPGAFVRLQVQDTGHGMPRDIQSRIFEPFFTTKELGKGTGLGLAMVFGIVKQHQGWIECHSEVGKGSRFDVYLPRSTSSPAGKKSAPALTRPCTGNETVLIVDDELVLRNVGRAILERYGYRVILAENGLKALEIYQSEVDRIDLILLDLTMPGLSGADTVHQLSQIDPHVRILLASGYSTDQALIPSSDRILGFISKPYSQDKLARKVRSVLDKAGPR